MIVPWIFISSIVKHRETEICNRKNSTLKNEFISPKPSFYEIFWFIRILRPQCRSAFFINLFFLAMLFLIIINAPASLLILFLILVEIPSEFQGKNVLQFLTAKNLKISRYSIKKFYFFEKTQNQRKMRDLWIFAATWTKYLK